MQADLSEGKDYEQAYGQAIEMLKKGRDGRRLTACFW